MSRVNLGRVTMMPKGVWSSSSIYKRLDIVTNNGVSYIALQDVPANTVVTNTTYWMAVTPEISIGDVSTLNPSQNASASITSTSTGKLNLNLGIPRGISGNETIDDDAGLGDIDVVWSANKTKTEINSKQNIILKSASGTIVSFDDGVEASVTRLVANIKPVQSGNDDPSPSNIRPITGWTNANIIRTKENLLTNTATSQLINGVYITINSDGSVILNGTTNASEVNLTFYNPWTKIGNYILSGIPSDTPTSLFLQAYSTNKSVSDRGNGVALNVEEGDSYRIRIHVNGGSNVTFNNLYFRPMIRLASAPYDRYPITFPSEAGTVYGGTLDVTNGVLTVTHRCAVIGDLSWTYDAQYSRFQTVINGIARSNPRTIKFTASCFVSIDDGRGISSVPENAIYCGSYSEYVYIKTSAFTSAEDFVSAFSGEKFVYPLASPVTYQLTPTEITTLLGQNYIWADIGDISIDYFCNKQFVDAIGNTIVDYQKQVINKLDAMITDNIEPISTATQNYTTGSLVIVQNQLIRVTQNIATGGAITIGSNAETIDLETLIAEKAEKILVAKLPFLSSASLYNNTADFHNAMPRGKDITSYLTDGSLWNRINGTNGYSLFEDLYIGDYLTAGGQYYTIVDFDYYIRCGDGMDITQHHLVMMPTGNMSIPEGTVLYGSEDTLTLINTANAGVTVTSQETATGKKWNATIDAPNTNTTAGGYKYSRIRQVIMKAADTIVVNAFGLAHIKPIPVLYPNPENAEASGLASDWTWFKNDDWSAIDRKSICDLPNEVQVCGTQVWGKGSTWDMSGYEIGTDKLQFALFKNNRALMNRRSAWWFRSVNSTSQACYITLSGIINHTATSSVYAVRPRFLLIG